jgi:tetratricopeptide (TPR) repeat protein
MKKSFVTTLFLMVAVAVSHGQTADSGEIDLDRYYAFPLSFGVEYQNLSPLTDYGMDVTAFELSGIVRYPLPFYPLIQPILQIGLMQFDLKDELFPDRWDHTHIFGTLGAGYMTRFTKEFEVGGELSIGYSQGIFTNLNPYFPELTYGSPTLIVSAGARVGLIPSFNMSINVHPNLRYLHSFSALKTFNGLLFNLGISVSYRIGEDPDSASTIVRSIRFGETQIQPLFAALQTYYTKNPIGGITISNTETFPIYDIELTFFQNGLMDNPTKLATIAELAPEEEKPVDIFATFNSDIFELEGLSPQTGELKAIYVSKGRTVEQKVSVEYVMNDKTSLTWTDDRKIAGYITKSDSTIDNYTKQILQYTKNDLNPGLSQRLQNAMQLYSALSEQGILYKVDPITAFGSAQGDAEVIDKISLPRDTLKYVTGDCDDLTVLFCSLLEIAGIPTGFITTPGHIYSAFNTGLPVNEYQSIHPDEKMSMNIKGEIWVPIEITMLGSDDFMAAWRRGAEEWNNYEQDATKRNFYETLPAQNIYTPVGLTAKDMGIQYANEKNIVERFNDDKDKLVTTILDTYNEKAKTTGRKGDYNSLGIMSAQFARYEQAEIAFKESIAIDRNSISPQVNLGNVYLLLERYIDAIQILHSVEESLVDGGREESLTYLKVLMSISRAYYELENFDKAMEYYDRVALKDPDLAAQYNFIAKGAG